MPEDSTLFANANRNDNKTGSRAGMIITYLADSGQ